MARNNDDLYETEYGVFAGSRRHREEKRARARRVIAAVLILAAALVIVTTRLNPAESKKHEAAGQSPDPGPVVKPAPTEIADEALASGAECRRAGAALSDEDRAIYAHLVHALDALETEITLDGVRMDDVERVFDAVLADYPEFFWLTGGGRWSEQTAGADSTVWFEPTFVSSLSQIGQKRIEARRICEQIIARTDGMSEYERALYFHDYLVEHTTYDDTSFEQTVTVPGTAYGCLVDHRAVCTGYAQAFQWLAQSSGLECFRVSGSDREDGVGHEWNCVLLDGAYYYIDVTWDDPVPEDGAEVLLHDYFCITTEELLQTHVLRSGQALPECTATACDYYRVNDLYFDDYDAGQVGARLRALADAGQREFSIKFGDPDECARAKDDLIDGQRIFQILDELNSVSYKTSENGRILTLFL